MKLRYHIELEGVTQGVGFRPAVYTLAAELGLAGWIINGSRGVTIEIEGAAQSLETFKQRLRRQLPPLARIDCWREWEMPEQAAVAFEIAASRSADPGRPPIPPDAAICPACRAELFDPHDRRYLYPFITCAHCGPRFTLVRAVPFDRERTAMDRFPMCAACQQEYGHPANRRFHAQTTSCWECGPVLRLIDAHGLLLAAGPAAVPAAIHLLLSGNVVAVKGIGGFHLAVNARDRAAVALLRQRKQRERKPFALMASTLETVRQAVQCDPAEADLLASAAAPIVLLDKLSGAGDQLSPDIAPGNPALGIMLPYSPLHALLFAHPAAGGKLDLLVMTSANQRDEPLQFQNSAAVAALGQLADAFLLHERDIVAPIDDSICRVHRGQPVPLRIGRGLVPAPLPIKSASRVILGAGADLKNSVFFLSPDGGYLSSHVGDLKTLAAYDGFRRAIAQYRHFFNLIPEAVGHDRHPDFLSSRWAREESGLPAIAVQHHHAHIAALMAEHGLREPILGIALDGTGLGADGQLWGGEFLLSRRSGFDRVGHLRPFPLPGGDAAVRSPARIAWAHLRTIFGQDWEREAGPLPGLGGPEQRVLERMLDTGTNCPLTTSAGRLFDAVSAYLGLCQRVTFEGEAAVALEAAAVTAEDRPGREYPFAIHCGDRPAVWDPEPMWRAAVADRRDGVPAGLIARRFTAGLARSCAAMAAILCRQLGIAAVGLSGGVFQNGLLMNELSGQDWAGLELYVHRLLPPNDACVAVGQAVVAEEELEHVSRRADAPVGHQTG